MKTWAIVSFTLRQTLRSRTMIVGLIISLFYLAVIPVLSSSNGGGSIVGEIDSTAASRDFLSFSLTGLNFIGMFMAIFTTLGAIYVEIERGTIHTIVTKPVHRWQVIVAKWAGHVLLMLAYVVLMGIALWMSVVLDSHNFIWPYLPALALVCLNVATMVTLTMLFSVFLPVVANAIFVFIIFMGTANLRVISTISHASDNILVTGLVQVLRLILPVSEVSDLAGSLLRTQAASALAQSQAGALTPRDWSFGFEVIYIAGVVGLAVLAFRNRDLV